MSRLGEIHDLARDHLWRADELRAEIGRRARILAARLGPERRDILIAHGDSAAFFLDLLAVWQAGGVAACANPGLSPPERARIEQFLQPAAILIAGEEPPGFAGPPLDLSAPHPDADPMPAPLDAPALRLFTSGTTGAPKAVTLTHRAIAARVALNAAHIGPGPLARSLNLLPTHFGHGLIGNCLTPLLNGSRLFLGAPGGLAGAAQLGGLIDDLQISFLSSVPSFWKIALRAGAPPRRARLARVHVGSAPLSPALRHEIEAWSGAPLWDMYGLTETANWVGGSDRAESGWALWGGEAAILDGAGQIAPAGEGEILLRSPALFVGYHQRDDLTDAAFRQGWFRTGDLGQLSDRGLIRMAGRARYVINVGGAKIYPEELDSLFETHPDIREACAFALPDPASGEAVGLAVAGAPGLAPAALRAWASERLRPEARPTRIALLEDIPKTDRGKINRDQVRAQAFPPAGARP